MPGTYDASTVPAAAPGGHRSGAAPQVAQPLPGRPEPGARSAADIPGRPQLDVTRVAVLDTTVCDDNLGNWIIMDGIHRALRTTLPASVAMCSSAAETSSQPTCGDTANGACACG
jgi:hypothetical protein